MFIYAKTHNLNTFDFTQNNNTTDTSEHEHICDPIYVSPAKVAKYNYETKSVKVNKVRKMLKLCNIF